MILQRSLSSYRHELLLENALNIPILQQHGDLDSNVPVTHSRRLSLLLSHTGSSSEYVELPGKDHWFEGVMTTLPLRKFFKRVLDSASSKPAPRKFITIVANPGDMGPRSGIVIDQLTSTGQLGKLSAEWSSTASIWQMETSNIERIHLTPAFFKSSTSSSRILIDGVEVDISAGSLPNQWIVRAHDGSWMASPIRLIAIA